MEKNSVRYIIFTGANERAIIATCRYFKMHGIPFSLVSRPGNDKIRKTVYKRNIDSLRKKDDLDLEDFLYCLDEVKRLYPHQTLHFIPSSESVNRLVLSNRTVFNSRGLIVNLCDEDVYLKISNKLSFLMLARSFGIDIPEQIEHPDTANIPYVAKPRTEYSDITGEKLYPHLILDCKDHDAFSSLPDKRDFICQDYIDGESYYYLMQINQDGSYEVRYQRNLLQQSHGKSVIAAVACHCPDKDFEMKIINALKSSGFYGLVMVEMMRTQKASWLIEANPRLWGPFQLAIQQGLKPILDAESMQSVSETTKSKPYLWLGGLMLNIASGNRMRRYFREEESLVSFILGAFSSDLYLCKDTALLFLFEFFNSMNIYVHNLMCKIFKEKRDAQN